MGGTFRPPRAKVPRKPEIFWAVCHGFLGIRNPRFPLKTARKQGFPRGLQLPFESGSFMRYCAWYKDNCVAIKLLRRIVFYKIILANKNISEQNIYSQDKKYFYSYKIFIASQYYFYKIIIASQCIEYK